MDEKTIRIIPFTDKKEKWLMWPRKFMSGSGIKEYPVLLTGDKTIISDNEY